MVSKRTKGVLSLAMWALIFLSLILVWAQLFVVALVTFLAGVAMFMTQAILNYIEVDRDQRIMLAEIEKHRQEQGE